MILKTKPPRPPKWSLKIRLIHSSRTEKRSQTPGCIQTVKKLTLERHRQWTQIPFRTSLETICSITVNNLRFTRSILRNHIAICIDLRADDVEFVGSNAFVSYSVDGTLRLEQKCFILKSTLANSVRLDKYWTWHCLWLGGFFGEGDAGAGSEKRPTVTAAALVTWWVTMVKKDDFLDDMLTDRNQGLPPSPLKLRQWWKCDQIAVGCILRSVD